MTRYTRIMLAACLAAQLPAAVTASAYQNTSGPYAGPWCAGPVPEDPDAPAGTRASRFSAALAALPVRFEANLGQGAAGAPFVAHGRGYGLALTPGGMVLTLQDPNRGPGASKRDVELDRAAPAAGRFEPVSLHMRLEGAGAVTPVGEEPLETRTNYLIGPDPSAWVTDVPSFARVRYPDVYPGIDLVVHGSAGDVRYDFVVAPGADPAAIRIAWEGASELSVDDSGALVLRAAGVELRQSAPVVFQETGADREAVAGAWALDGSGAALRVGSYDAARPLVIDPVITYSTYVGQSSYETARDVALDSTGAAYIAGEARNDAAGNAVVVKLNAAGSQAVYWTHFGGSAMDAAYGVAVDSSGAAYITGVTESTDMPAPKGYDATHNGGRDGFVARLNAAGNGVTYATYLGGAQDDYAIAVAIDEARAPHVSGWTRSANFPLLRALDVDHDGIFSEAFVSKLEMPPGGSKLRMVYSTFLGGAASDSANDIAVHEGAAFVTGRTNSHDFPTANALDPTNNAGTDAFVSKLVQGGGSAQVALSYSTFLGGTGVDAGHSIAVSTSGSAAVAGETGSADFPLKRAFDTTLGGDRDGFVARLSATGSSLSFSTLLGGSGDDSALGVAVSSKGEVYVTGSTESANFPTASAVDATHNGKADVFVTRLKLRLSLFNSNPPVTVVYSTFLGGGEMDWGHGIAVDPAGAAYVTGGTHSSGLPAVGAFDPSFNGATDMLVAKLT